MARLISTPWPTALPPLALKRSETARRILPASNRATKTFGTRISGLFRISRFGFRISSLFHFGAMGLALLLSVGSVSGKPPKSEPAPILLAVMDPLAKELACACVKGYGQRDYRKLAARLETVLKQRVSIEFSDDLAETMALA